MPINVFVGEQRGDEGKGAVVDMFAGEADIVARFNGANNAGHKVGLPDGRLLKLRVVPSGIAHDGVMNVVGNGVAVDASSLDSEITDLEDKGIEVSRANFKMSSACPLILPHYVFEELIQESGDERQNTSKAGVAETFSHKALRKGVRAEIIKNDPDKLRDLIFNALVAQRVRREEAGLEIIDALDVAKSYVDSAVRLGQFITDTVLYINRELRKDTPAHIIAEGAQGFLLDPDHGMTPYTTSSNTVAGQVCVGLGVPTFFVEKVIGISKAIQSHVGDGVFVSEITDPELLARLHGDLNAPDAEKGTNTTRTRRLGYLDLPQIRRAQMVNGTSEMVLTKLDWVPRFKDDLKICVAYERKGKTLEVAPDTGRKLEQCTPILESVDNWSEDILGVQNFADLPPNAQKYIKRIEELLGTPISVIRTGPERNQAILR